MVRRESKGGRASAPPAVKLLPAPHVRRIQKTESSTFAKNSGYPIAQLHAMVDSLGSAPTEAELAEVVAFVCGRSRGHWHNRARAKLCRRLKHVALSPPMRKALVDAILDKFLEGAIDEQFRDQLRLLLHLDSFAVEQSTARVSIRSPLSTRRLAIWVRNVLARRSSVHRESL
jgi:hypothetical protein